MYQPKLKKTANKLYMNIFGTKEKQIPLIIQHYYYGQRGLLLLLLILLLLARNRVNYFCGASKVDELSVTDEMFKD